MVISAFADVVGAYLTANAMWLPGEFVPHSPVVFIAPYLGLGVSEVEHRLAGELVPVALEFDDAWSLQ